jgi:hypothetical protein
MEHGTSWGLERSCERSLVLGSLAEQCLDLGARLDSKERFGGKDGIEEDG